MIYPNHDKWWGKYITYLKKESKEMVTLKPRLYNKYNEKTMILAFHFLKVGIRLYKMRIAI